MAVTLGARTGVSAPWPAPDNATARVGIGNIWDFLNEVANAAEVDMLCAATLDIGGQNSSKLRLTGSAIPIASLGTKYRGPIFIRISNTYTFQHNSTSLICPGNRNLTVSAGDYLVAVAKSDVSGTSNGWQLSVINRGDGGALFSGQVRIIGSQPLAFEGSTDDSFQTIFSVVEPTADRTITIPNSNVDLSTLRAATTALAGFGRVATWSEAQAGSLTGNVFLSPEAFNWSRAFGTTGYVKFPGSPGLLLQWGTVAGNFELAAGVTAVAGGLYYTTFNGVLQVVCSIEAPGTNSSQVVCHWDRGGSSLSSPKFWVQELASGSQPNWNISYVALGY